MLGCLAKETFCLWDLLALLSPTQLKALSSSEAFFNLPLGPDPPAPPPAATLAVLLEVRRAGARTHAAKQSMRSTCASMHSS